MVGTRNIAFPRLNAFGYWIYLFGGLLLYVALPPEHRPGRRLVRLRAARRARSTRPGKRVDIWAQMITFTEIAALVGAVEHHRHGLQACARRACRSTACRCSSGRCWSPSFMVIFAMPCGDAGEHVARDRTGWSARTSSTRPKAATRCCGSTCSGSSATPRSTSSSSRRSGFVSAIVATFARRPIVRLHRRWCCRWSRPAFIGFGAVGAPHVRHRPAAARARASSPPRA